MGMDCLTFMERNINEYSYMTRVRANEEYKGRSSAKKYRSKNTEEAEAIDYYGLDEAEEKEEENS